MLASAGRRKPPARRGRLLCPDAGFRELPLASARRGSQRHSPGGSPRRAERRGAPLPRAILHSPEAPMLSRKKFFILCLLFGSALPLTAAPSVAIPGWARFELPESGSYLWRYLPLGADLSKQLPAVLFLHGSGGIPDKYRPFLVDAAQRAGLVVILPKSSTDLGWGNAQDERIVEESLRTVRAELPLDPRRTSIGGHSAGGAWAYLLAYGTSSGYSAVFTMAARFYQIDAVSDPSYKAPI